MSLPAHLMDAPALRCAFCGAADVRVFRCKDDRLRALCPQHVLQQDSEDGPLSELLAGRVPPVVLSEDGRRAMAGGVWALREALLMPLRAAHDRRVSELLDANSREVEARRRLAAFAEMTLRFDPSGGLDAEGIQNLQRMARRALGLAE